MFVNKARSALVSRPTTAMFVNKARSALVSRRRPAQT